MGYKESMIAIIVATFLRNFLDENDLGIVLGADGPCRLKPGRIRMPDVAFFDWASLPDDLPDEPVLDAIPDLAVEVISKCNTAKEMTLKLKDYFKAGVKLVWYIDPDEQTVEVYTTPTSKKVLN